jgi:hypothetical protein
MENISLLRLLSENSLKQGDALLTLLSYLALYDGISKIRENHVRLKLKGLPYPNNVNLLGDNIHCIKKNISSLLAVGKEVGLEVNAERTKYTRVLLSRHKNGRKNYDTKKANSSFQMRQNYLRTTVTNQYSIQEGINRRVNYGNACYHLVLNS